MHIIVPDECPGRCENYRQRYMVSRGVVIQRCLGEIGKRHVCAFEPWPKELPNCYNFSSNLTSPRKSWVAPDSVQTLDTT